MTVAAVLVPRKFPFEEPLRASRLRDSKKLTAEQREEWFKFLIASPHVLYAISSVPPARIDCVNITRAANKAATAAFKMLASKSPRKAQKSAILLDAGLALDPAALKAFGIAVMPKALVKGDEKIQAIAFASIIAKVTRDRYMKRLHRKHPAYGFDIHKGYGTSAHIRALRARGPSPIHRLTFIKKYVSIKT